MDELTQQILAQQVLAQGVFPRLYKKSSTGKIQDWQITVVGDSIVVERGQHQGRMVVDKKPIKGKNIGRSNETTPEQQACLEAESKFKKQKDKGYFESMQDAETNIVMLPMLALDFRKRSHDIVYPAVVQRKYDGVRCIADVKNGMLLSRKGKFFPHLDHIKEAIFKIFENTGVFPDGELFSDELPFEEVVGLVKKEKLKDGDEDRLIKIKFQIYDSIILEQPKAVFGQRFVAAKRLVKANPNPNGILNMVENFRADQKEDIRRLHDQFVGEGYEGAIIRNTEGEYSLNHRSKDLQKFKDFKEAEYEIVGYEEATGNDAGTVVWVCKVDNRKNAARNTGETSVGDVDAADWPDQTKDGENIFRARPKGTREQRRFWFNNGDQFIGRKLTVIFQEFTKYGFPRFPVGKSIRD